MREQVQECEGEGWTFIYLGANQDAWAEGGAMGMAKAGQTYGYTSSPSGLASSFKSINVLGKAHRAGGQAFANTAAKLNSMTGGTIAEEGLTDEQHAQLQAEIDKAKEKVKS